MSALSRCENDSKRTLQLCLWAATSELSPEAEAPQVRPSARLVGDVFGFYWRIAIPFHDWTTATENLVLALSLVCDFRDEHPGILGEVMSVHTDNGFAIVTCEIPS